MGRRNKIPRPKLLHFNFYHFIDQAKLNSPTKEEDEFVNLEKNQLVLIFPVNKDSFLLESGKNPNLYL